MKIGVDEVGKASAGFGMKIRRKTRLQVGIHDATVRHEPLEFKTLSHSYLNNEIDSLYSVWLCLKR